MFGLGANSRWCSGVTASLPLSTVSGSRVSQHSRDSTLFPRLQLRVPCHDLHRQVEASFVRYPFGKPGHAADRSAKHRQSRLQRRRAPCGTIEEPAQHCAGVRVLRVRTRVCVVCCGGMPRAPEGGGSLMTCKAGQRFTPHS